MPSSSSKHDGKKERHRCVALDCTQRKDSHDGEWSAFTRRHIMDMLDSVYERVCYLPSEITLIRERFFYQTSLSGSRRKTLGGVEKRNWRL